MLKKMMLVAAAALVAGGTVGCVPPGDGTPLGKSSSKTAGQTASAEETTTAFALPDPGDFVIQIIELERNCFGSAGCNVQYSVSPSYIGPGVIPDDAKFKVLYQINGAESPKTGYMTVRDGGFYGDEEGYVSTPSGGQALTATVTQVIG